MPAIVDYPTVVKKALKEFGPLFRNEPQRRHFAGYLTGLMIAHKKNVSAINRQFAFTTDQPCLNHTYVEDLNSTGRCSSQATEEPGGGCPDRARQSQAGPDRRSATMGVHQGRADTFCRP